jgi:cytochrome P450
MEGSTQHAEQDAQHFLTDLMQCPYPHYEEYLAEDPVPELPARDGYMITRYEDVVWAARHPENFTSMRVRYDEDDPDAAAIAAKGYPSPATVVDNDPPAHTKYREAGFQAFAPKRLEVWEPTIRVLTDELIDGFVERGEADFGGEFCRQFPMAVVCEMLGVERTAGPRLSELADARTELLQKYVPRQRALQLQELVVEFEQFIAAEIEDRQTNPRDDVLTEIIQTPHDPSIEMELPHLIAMVKIIFTAGTETTSYLLANALWLLLTLDGLYDRVLDDLSLVPQLLEETMRFESPAQWSQRRCVVDTEIGGKVIPAGSRILLMWAAGNRDDSLFPGASGFDLDRSNSRRNLGFGIGPHTCVGAPLARLEARIAMEQVLTRLRDLRLADPSYEPAWVNSTVLRGLAKLPIRFAPGERVAS